MRILKRLLLLVLVAGGVWAALAWPRVDQAEAARDYAAGEDAAARAVQEAVSRLPGWSYAGSGKGPLGSAVHAVRTLPVLPLRYDVAIVIRRQAGGSRVSIRSKSRLGDWDFGQNARNIRVLLAELDRVLR